MGDRDREARLRRRIVRPCREAVHDRRPVLARVHALVDRVAPEGGVQGRRVLRIQLDVGGAVRFLPRLLEGRPVDAAVGRLPDPVARVLRGSRAPGAAAAAQDRGIEVVRVPRVDDEPGGGDTQEVVTRDVVPVDAAVGRLEDPVAEHAVARERAFTGAGIDDRVVRRRNRDRADRQRVLVVGPRSPGSRASRVVGPDAALRGTEDELVVARPDRKCADATGDGGKRVRAALDLRDRVRPERHPRAFEGGRAR